MNEFYASDSLNVQRNASASNWKTATISNNLMFRKVMEDPDMCKPLLERVLDVKIQAVSLIVPENSLEMALDAKGVRLDLLVTAADGTVFDVEMQVDGTRREELGLRARYYEAELDLDALRKGAHYIDLRQSYIIFICMFDPFGEGLPKYTFEETCCENPALQLNDRATKVFVNVHGDKSKMSKELAAVAAYFSDGVVSDEYTAEIDNRVNVNRQDSRLERDNMRMEEFLWEERYWAGKKAREEGLAEGREAGLAEGRVVGLAEGRVVGLEMGRAEGRAEGRDERSQEIAWNLYEAKLPLDMIAKTTQLTLEQVKAVIKKHNVLI